jgi:25S rRNA (cytosine2278-C5)-methyltransferase
MDAHAEQFRDVKAVLLDPSCSGSGTAAVRQDHLLPCSVAGRAASADSAASAEAAAEADSAASAKAAADADSAASAEAAAEAPAVPAGEQQRVARLAAFQARALRHALSFPAARRVVYSTCSVYLEENEAVVAEVLPAAAAAGFALVPALPGWPRRGLRCGARFPWADLVLRVHPELDGLDGFFVALFARKGAPRKG